VKHLARSGLSGNTFRYPAGNSQIMDGSTRLGTAGTGFYSRSQGGETVGLATEGPLTSPVSTPGVSRPPSAPSPSPWRPPSRKVETDGTVPREFDKLVKRSLLIPGPGAYDTAAAYDTVYATGTPARRSLTSKLGPFGPGRWDLHHLALNVQATRPGPASYQGSHVVADPVGDRLGRRGALSRPCSAVMRSLEGAFPDPHALRLERAGRLPGPTDYAPPVMTPRRAKTIAQAQAAGRAGARGGGAAGGAYPVPATGSGVERKVPGGTMGLKAKSELQRQFDRGEIRPGPGEYLLARKLPPGTKFNTGERRSDLDQLVAKETKRPGPASYDTTKWGDVRVGDKARRPGERVLGGNISPSKKVSSLDLLVQRAAQLPGPGAHSHERAAAAKFPDAQKYSGRFTSVYRPPGQAQQIRVSRASTAPARTPGTGPL